MPEVNIQEALGSVRKLAVMMRALDQVAGVLGDIGDLDQAARDAEARCETARAELAKISGDLSEATIALDQSRSERKRVVAAATYASASSVDAVDVMLANAREKAEAIIQGAKAEAEKMRAFAENQRGAHLSWMSDANKVRSELEEQLADLRRELAAIKERL